MALSFTRDQQHRPFASSGNKLTEDGSPLHSRVGIDMMTSINNMALAMPFAGFVHAYSTVNAMQVAAQNNVSSGTPEEWFAAQLPTVFPHDAIGRFCWTLGLQLQDQMDAAGTIDLDAVTIYLSRTPYLDVMCVPTAGPSYITPTSYAKFKPSALEGPAGVSSIATALSMTHGNPDAYYLIDNSAGTTGTLLPFQALTEGGLSPVHLVVTTTAHQASGSGVGLGINLMDFTWWIEPE